MSWLVSFLAACVLQCLMSQAFERCVSLVLSRPSDKCLGSSWHLCLGKCVMLLGKKMPRVHHWVWHEIFCSLVLLPLFLYKCESSSLVCGTEKQNKLWQDVLCVPKWIGYQFLACCAYASYMVHFTIVTAEMHVIATVIFLYSAKCLLS